MSTVPPSPDSEAIAHASDIDARNRKLGRVFTVVIIAMFLVGFASIPAYRWICMKVNPGGSAWFNGQPDDYTGVVADTSRKVRVRFTTNVERQLPWNFYPEMPSMEVHPGEKKLVKFYAKNLDTTGAIKGKAVYDINPPEAGQFFKKIECFCFIEQTLEAGEEVEMPLYFWFDPQLPPHIKEITLAYTFFNFDSSMERSLKAREASKR